MSILEDIDKTVKWLKRIYQEKIQKIEEENKFLYNTRQRALTLLAKAYRVKQTEDFYEETRQLFADIYEISPLRGR